MMELSCYRVLLLVAVLGLAYGEALNHFIRHYEPLHYDQDDLMYHHRRLRRSLVGPSDISLQFNAFGRYFDLALKPEKKLLHPNFTLRIDNHVVRNHQLKSFLYTGEDRDDPSVSVHGNLFHGVFEGTVYTPDEEYHIEPANRYLNDSSHHSIIYRGSDLDVSTVAGATCGSTHEDIQQELLKTQMIGHTRDSGRRLRKRQNSPYAPQYPNADPDRVRCWLNVIGDYKFVQSVGGAGTAMGQLLTIIQQASLIYERTTDFNPQGSRIQFGIQNIDVESSPPPPSDPFANDFLGVQAFLDLHSRQDYSQYCLSYRFTNRDFDNGVVGLAYIGQPLGSNAAGGICDNPITQNGVQKTLNTGIVTNLNFGRQIPPSLSVLTFAHEVGHNFGSDHDPMDPVPDGGAFIMSAFATDGSRPNNNEFSPRSIGVMVPVVRTRGQDSGDGCFEPGDNMCGNRFIDEGEECDCGSNQLMPNGICMNDPCCNGTSCMLASNMACSPEQGPCCSADCTFRDSTTLCSNETECAMAQTCNGMEATCPPAEPKMPMENQTLTCNNGENVCVNETCSGSICLALGLSACECTGNAMEACEVCCEFNNGSCISTFAIVNSNDPLAQNLPNGQGRNLQIGFPCKNFTGYCDFFNQCMVVDNDGAINRLADFFLNSAGFQQAIDWIVNMWWVVLIVIVGLLVIMFVIVVIFHIILPRPKYRRKAATMRRQQRTVPLDNYPKGHSQAQYHRY